MKEQDLTEAQKKALPDLYKRANRTALKISIKSVFLLIAGCFSIIAVNEILIHNGWFVGTMAFFTGIMVSNLSTQERREAVAKYAEELKNIK